MRLRMIAALGAGAVALGVPVAAGAHFVLLEPTASLVQDVRGDPQKMGPCGGTSANRGTPSGAVSPVVGGSALPLKVRESIYHPGYYRVALSVLNRSELPADPADTVRDSPTGPRSVSGKIDDTHKPPVLVDGLWLHRDRAQNREFATNIRIPNINCDHCTLQVIQFMEEHGVNADGRFTYHHCADLKITANPNLPIEAGWPGQGRRGR